MSSPRSVAERGDVTKQHHYSVPSPQRYSSQSTSVLDVPSEARLAMHFASCESRQKEGLTRRVPAQGR